MEQRLSDLERRIEELEERQEYNDIELEAVKDFVSVNTGKTELRLEEIERRLQKREEDEPKLSQPTAETCEEEEGASQVSQKAVPVELVDLADVWQEKLANFATTVTTGEKLTQAQLAFFFFYLEENRQRLGMTGRMAESMIQVGQEEGFWPQGWTPTETRDFKGYLVDTLKNVKRRDRKRGTREELECRTAAAKTNLDVSI